MGKVLVKVLLSGLFIVSIVSSVALAADIKAGKAKYNQTCRSCHGVNGKNKNPIYPVLHGRKASYIEKNFKDIKSGKRKNNKTVLMLPFTKAVSDSDIKNIAAYLASVK